MLKGHALTPKNSNRHNSHKKEPPNKHALSDFFLQDFRQNFLCFHNFLHQYMEYLRNLLFDS